MGVFAEIFRTAARASVAGAQVIAERSHTAAPPEPHPSRKRKKKVGCSQCRAVDEIMRQRKRYGLEK